MSTYELTVVREIGRECITTGNELAVAAFMAVRTWCILAGVAMDEVPSPPPILCGMTFMRRFIIRPNEVEEAALRRAFTFKPTT